MPVKANPISKDPRYKRLHNIWGSMKQRCTNPKKRSYKWYGQKGIKVCPEWMSFPNFFSWAINNGYADGLTIDRINTDKGYEPSNCRWADKNTQINNKSSTLHYAYNGKEMPLIEIARETGIDRHFLYQRVRLLGYPIEEAIEFPSGEIPRSARRRSNIIRITWNEKTMTLDEWGDELGIKSDTLYARIYRRNWSIEKAFTEPVKAKKAG